MSAGLVALGGCGGSSAPPGDQARDAAEAVTEAEVDRFVADLLALSPSPVVCAEAAASIALCERSLSEADPVVGLPEGPVDASEGIALRNGSMRVVLRGRLTSGAEFRSEIEVLRQDGEVLAVDPVYWVPRDVVG